MPPTTTYEDAVKNLEAGPLKGPDLDAAKASLQSYYNTKPVTTISSNKGKSIITGTVAPALAEATQMQTGAAKVRQEDQNPPADLDLNSILSADDQADLMLENDASVQEYRRAIRGLTLANNADAAAQIASLDQSYDALRAATEKSNQYREGSYTTAGIRSGMARYAPEGAADLVATVREQGMKKLAEIDSEYNAAVAAVRASLAQKNYTAAATSAQTVLNLKKQFLETINKNKEEVRKLEIQASRDTAIAGLVAQGVTDPVELLDRLNFDDSGKRVGDFTLKEVREALNAITPKGSDGDFFKFDTKTVGPLLASGFSSQDIRAMQEDLNSGATIDQVLAGVPAQQQSAVRKALGVPSGGLESMTPGVGAADPTQELLIRRRLFSRVSPLLNKGSLSDADRAYIDGTINTLREQGLSEQQILDAFSGFPAGVTTPYNSAFRDVAITATDTTDEQTQLLGKVSTFIANGNYKAAMQTVENAAMTKAKKVDPDNFLGQGTATTYTKKIDDIKSILEGAGIVGPVQGSFQNLLGKLKGNKAQEVRSKVAALVAQMRNDLSGTAVTESEARFLEPLIPDLSDKKSNFLEKLDALQTNVLRQHNDTREIGGLPAVNVSQILDPNARLQLYSSDTASGIFGGDSTTVDL